GIQTGKARPSPVSPLGQRSLVEQGEPVQRCRGASPCDLQPSPCQLLIIRCGPLLRTEFVDGVLGRGGVTGAQMQLGGGGDHETGSAVVLGGVGLPPGGEQRPEASVPRPSNV